MVFSLRVFALAAAIFWVHFSGFVIRGNFDCLCVCVCVMVMAVLTSKHSTTSRILSNNQIVSQNNGTPILTPTYFQPYYRDTPKRYP